MLTAVVAGDSGIFDTSSPEQVVLWKGFSRVAVVG
jgi:hypothetical protein